MKIMGPGDARDPFGPGIPVNNDKIVRFVSIPGRAGYLHAYSGRKLSEVLNSNRQRSGLPPSPPENIGSPAKNHKSEKVIPIVIA